MIESTPISSAALHSVRAETPAPDQTPLSQCIQLQRAFSRSINLARDSETLDPIHHYQPTSRALEALRQILPGLSTEAGQRALALIGPYGAGKSAFGLFLGALLGARDSTARQVAHSVLKRTDAELAEQIHSRVVASRGFLRVQINGLPDSLSRQLLLALAAAVEREGLPEKFVNRLQAAARAGAPMDQILNRIGEIQTAWAESGGAGVLIEIDELGKFLEYESHHPQQREIHLLQLLAERAAEPSRVPLYLVVMLHQAFEYYGNRLGSRLRELVGEWLALRDLPRRQAALHQDPVAQREHQTWLANAESEALGLIQTLIEEPEASSWFFGGMPAQVRDRRDLQRRLSEWIDDVYHQAPLIRNELINRERPSTSAATGRKRLLAAMLGAADRTDLGIEKDPAEKSLYLSLLKQSGLHRREDGEYGFFAPPEHDPCRLRPLWDAIADTLGADGARQVPVPELYARLQRPPFGVRLGVLPILLVAYLLAHRRETALYQEGVFCDTLTLEQAELLCRRPALFALERYALQGLRGELFEQYLASIVGRIGRDATLLDIVRPLVRFIAQLPDYSQQGGGVSEEARQVARIFRQAKRPGALLFEDLPRVCGVSPEAFAAQEPGVVDAFIQRLIALLRELRDAYPALLDDWRLRLGHALLETADREEPEVATLRGELAERYRGLERYAPELSPVGAFARRLADSGFRSDEAWLESVMTLLGGAPAGKWRDSNRLQAEARLAEFAEQLRDLRRLRDALPETRAKQDAVLLKRIDPERGEVSHVLALSSAERQAAAERAVEIATGLADLDETQRLAVVAALLEHCSDAVSNRTSDST